MNNLKMIFILMFSKNYPTKWKIQIIQYRFKHQGTGKNKLQKRNKKKI